MKKSSRSNKSMQEQPTTSPSASPPASQLGLKRFFRSPKGMLIIICGLFVVLIIILAITNNNKTEPAKGAAAQVSITSDKFFPQTIQIKAGQSVTWTNQDSKAHWVASDPYPSNDKLSGLSSNALDSHDSYTYSFDKAGTYTYHDQLNPYKLLGTVKVQ